jgi:arylsulfatase A-like enzyme
MRKTYVRMKSIAAGILATGVLALGTTWAEERPNIVLPNIVLIVTDDQGYGDASCYWETDLQTPVIDSLARDGVRFTQFRVHPLCAPTRASLLTGLYPQQAGMWRGPGALERGREPAGGWPADARRVRDEIRLLPQYLKDAGYATGLFGKWHLGYDERNVPNARGFDEFVGFLGGAHPYWPRERSQLQHNATSLQTDLHTTDLFADHAIAFITANRSRPFFCYVAFNAVHGPLYTEDRPRTSATPEWLARYEAAGVPQPRRDYCAVMSHADARIGTILETLQTHGLERRTLVICLSDNGGILEKYPSNNGPFRGGKGQAYEGGIRVPAVMRWSGTIPADLVSDAQAVAFDVFATVLDAAGVEVDPQNGGYEVSGVSLLPHLESEGKTQLAERTLHWDLYGSQAVLAGRWKLVGELPNHRGDYRQAVADAEGAQYELFDLAQDPGEKQNLAAAEPKVYERLKRLQLDWLQEMAEGAASGSR